MRLCLFTRLFSLIFRLVDIRGVMFRSHKLATAKFTPFNYSKVTFLKSYNIIIIIVSPLRLCARMDKVFPITVTRTDWHKSIAKSTENTNITWLIRQDDSIQRDLLCVCVCVRCIRSSINICGTALSMINVRSLQIFRRTKAQNPNID